MSSPQPPYYRECIRRELSRRLERNPSYSLRAFARALDVPASTLSRALSGKRGISLDAAGRIVAGLGLTPRESALFLSSLSLRPDGAQPATRAAAAAADVHDLDEESFRVVADLHHYAIMELTYVKGFRSDPDWIAARLGIAPMDARLAIDRLKRLGLLRQDGKRLRKAHRTLWSNAGGQATTAALRSYQRQCLAKAQAALDELPFERRTASAMTMPIDPAKLPLARQMIEEFAIELCRTLATGGMTDVYQLSINFHSLLKGDPK